MSRVLSFKSLCNKAIFSRKFSIFSFDFKFFIKLIRLFLISSKLEKCFKSLSLVWFFLGPCLMSSLKRRNSIEIQIRSSSLYRVVERDWIGRESEQVRRRIVVVYSHTCHLIRSSRCFQPTMRTSAGSRTSCSGLS